MEMLKNLDELFEKAKGRKAVVSLAGGEDVEALKALKEAKDMGIIESAIVVGKRGYEDDLKDLGLDFETVSTDSDEETAEIAVKLVSSGKAQVLMKGLIKTSTLLKAVLNKEWGLRTGRLLSHVILAHSPHVEKVYFITDGGMVIRPTLEQKVEIIKNAVELAHRLGYEKPRVALIAAVEVVNPDMPETVEAAVIAKMTDRGQIKGAVIDGPLGFDNAVSEFAASVKKVKGEVAGKADILVVPDIHSGNFLGKSFVYVAGGTIAGLVVGAGAPIVIVSRADTMKSKLLSIALAMATY
jgi:phosphate butyryltransferase